LEAGGLEPRERVLRLDSGAAPEVVDLRGGERLDLNLGTRGVERGDHPLVVLEGPVGVMAADDVDLAHLRADHTDDVLDGVLEGAVLPLLPGESAEGAREHADVRGRDVAVDDEVDPVALAARSEERRVGKEWRSRWTRDA